MKKTMYFFAITFVIGVASAFTVKPEEESKSAGLFANTLTLSCQPVITPCTGNAQICTQYRRLENCFVDARRQ